MRQASRLPAGNAFAESAASLLEALAEGASAVLAEADAPALRLPPIEPLRGITARLDRAGIEWAVGASGLLASLGLVDQVNDWDIQVEADPEALRALYADLPHEFHGHGGCHADWKLSFEEARTEVIPRFAFFVPGGVARVRLAVTRHWHGLPIASPEGWAVAYALMGEMDEPALRARRAARAGCCSRGSSAPAPIERGRVPCSPSRYPNDSRHGSARCAAPSLWPVASRRGGRARVDREPVPGPRQRQHQHGEREPRDHVPVQRVERLVQQVAERHHAQHAPSPDRPAVVNSPTSTGSRRSAPRTGWSRPSPTATRRAGTCRRTAGTTSSRGPRASARTPSRFPPGKR
jgi:hypothetical protein